MKDERIYYLTDRDDQAYVLESYLKNEGIGIETFSSVKALLEGVSREEPGLIMLDRQTLGQDWTAALREIRTSVRALIYVLTKRDDPMSRITALSIGADMCICDDIMPVEMAAYIKAFARRCTVMSRKGSSICYGDLELSEQEHTALASGRALSLTPNEFDFLVYMIKAGKAVSKSELIKAIWKTDERYLLTHVTEDLVKRLRKKLIRAESVVRIEAVWGFGYRLSMEDGDKDKALT